jgi:hypothetical protein
MFYINDLLRYRILREGISRRRPSNGVAVELSDRTGLGFAGA